MVAQDKVSREFKELRALVDMKERELLAAHAIRRREVSAKIDTRVAEILHLRQVGVVHRRVFPCQR